MIVECAPDTWRGLGLDGLGVDEGLRLLERIFEEQLADGSLVAKGCEGDRLRWLTFRRVTNRSWHAGNVVLVGDSAHTTHFSIGSGMRFAIEDAIALATEIDGRRVLAAALAAYEHRRRHELVRGQRDARLSAQWFENVPRYARRDPHTIFELMCSRRSPLLHRLPPRLYVRRLRAWQGEATELVAAATRP